VSNGDFETTGTSDGQLIINGLVYSSSGDVRLMRGYETESMNNTNPATLINYRPDFAFNMPTSLTKSLFNWREGR